MTEKNITSPVEHKVEMMMSNVPDGWRGEEMQPVADIVESLPKEISYKNNGTWLSTRAAFIQSATSMKPIVARDENDTLFFVVAKRSMPESEAKEASGRVLSAILLGEQYAEVMAAHQALVARMITPDEFSKIAGFRPVDFHDRMDELETGLLDSLDMVERPSAKREFTPGESGNEKSKPLATVPAIEGLGNQTIDGSDVSSHVIEIPSWLKSQATQKVVISLGAVGSLGILAGCTGTEIPQVTPELLPPAITADVPVTSNESTATSAPEIVGKVVETAIPTEMFTATPTQTPTEAPTPTPTEIPLMERLPEEWVGKIDRIETLKDGRVVAIAKAADEGQEAIYKALQYNKETQSWEKYQPIVSYVYLDNYIPNPDILKNIEIPERVVPLVDSKGFEVPMGSLATVSYDGEYPKRLIPALIADVFEIGDGQDMVVFYVEREDNDGIFLVWRITNDDMPSWVNYYMANKIDIANIILESERDGYSDMSNLWDGFVKVSNVGQYNFFKNNINSLRGTQVVLNWAESLNINTSNGTIIDDQRWMIDMVEGKIDLRDENKWGLIIEGFIIPDSMSGIASGK